MVYTMVFKSKFFTISLFLIIIGISIFYYFGLLINNTYSMPLGIYQIKKEDQYISKNDLVVFNIPQMEEKLLKKVVATKNDLVVVNETGVYVNGTLLENSKIFSFDTKGNPLKRAELNKILNENEIFAMGEHIRSYDSRYFGIINIKENKVLKVDKLFIWSN